MAVYLIITGEGGRVGEGGGRGSGSATLVAAKTVMVMVELFEVEQYLELLAQNFSTLAELSLRVDVEVVHLFQLYFQFLQELPHLQCNSPAI